MIVFRGKWINLKFSLTSVSFVPHSCSLHPAAPGRRLAARRGAARLRRLASASSRQPAARRPPLPAPSGPCLHGPRLPCGPVVPLTAEVERAPRPRRQLRRSERGAAASRIAERRPRVRCLLRAVLDGSGGSESAGGGVGEEGKGGIECSEAA